MLTRREALFGGALTLVFSSARMCCCSAATSVRTKGCLLDDSDLHRIYPVGTETQRYVHGDEPIIYKSGDANFDYALAQTLAKLAVRFEVVPGFAYYDDSEAKNAYATRRVRISGADGTVLMGTNFLQELRTSRNSPEVAVAGVCSHEFGHIVQFKHGLIARVNAGQPTIKRSELQADYFAGYFTGLRKRERPSYPALVVASTQAQFGHEYYGNEDHHGTPSERRGAVMKGFDASFRENRTLTEAIEESTTYVLTL